jgi:hypothetical protein
VATASPHALACTPPQHVLTHQEAGLRPEEATLLGERNSLLHYATKLERAQKEAAETAQRRLDGSVKMVRLFSVLERVHGRTLARRFAVWRMITFGQVSVGVPPHAHTPPSRTPPPPPHTHLTHTFLHLCLLTHPPLSSRL